MPSTTVLDEQDALVLRQFGKLRDDLLVKETVRDDAADGSNARLFQLRARNANYHLDEVFLLLLAHGRTFPDLCFCVK